MFLFDLTALFASTFVWASLFGYTPKAIFILCFLVVTVGLIVLQMKGNYRIREFNTNFKNIYLLFEGIVMTHVLPSLYLVIFAASKIDSARFIATNIFTIFVLGICCIFVLGINKKKNILKDDGEMEFIQ